MRRGLAILVVAAACGPKQTATPVAAKHEPPTQEVRVEPPRRSGAAAKRPTLDLDQLKPDFHDELRWPLSGSTHPALEPQFAIAREFAMAGVEWEELCARGVQYRTSSTQRELLSYVRGWCFVAKRDVDNACAQLVPLLGSSHRGLSPAVRQDLANILVQEGADKAEHWLTKHNVRDVALLDVLAANFVEVGSTTDALALNRRASDSDDYASHATECRRLVKRIVLGDGGDKTVAFEELKRLAVPAKSDETCVRLWNKVACEERFPRTCHAHFLDEKIDTRMILLAEVYEAWPAGLVKQRKWWAVADTAKRALPLDDAAELVLAAWDAALRADAQCSGELAAALHNALDTIRAATKFPKERIDALAKACPRPALPAPPVSRKPMPTPPPLPPPPPTRTPPSAPAPPPPPPTPVGSGPCDAEALKEQGMQNINMGQHAAALIKFEASLACRDNSHTLQLAFMASCASGNSAKATQYYKQLPPYQQQRFAQMCMRNNTAYQPVPPKPGQNPAAQPWP